MVYTEKGVRAMVDAIEKEKASAAVPALPWAPMSLVLRYAPLPSSAAHLTRRLFTADPSLLHRRPVAC